MPGKGNSAEDALSKVMKEDVDKEEIHNSSIHLFIYSSILALFAPTLDLLEELKD